MRSPNALINSTALTVLITCGLLPIVSTIALQPAVITVHAGDNLQSKVNQAECGDSILIDAGAVFSTSGDNGIVFSHLCSANPVIVTSTKAASLPATVGISDQANMARIETTGPTPAVTISGSGYRIIGLEITTKQSPQYTGILVNVQGSDNTLDRNYIHSLEDGTDEIHASVKIGVFVSGPRATITGNRIAVPGALILGSSTFDNTAAVMDITESDLTLNRNFLSAHFTPLFFGGGDLKTSNTATIGVGATKSQATFSNVNNLNVGDLVALAVGPATEGYSGLYFEVAKVTGINGKQVSYVPWAGSIGSKPGCTGDCGIPLTRAPISPGEARWNGMNPSARITQNTIWINPTVAAKIYADYGRVPKGFIEAKAGDFYLEGNDFTGWPSTFAFTQHNQTGPHGGPSPWSKLSVVFRNNRVANISRAFGSQVFGILLEDNVGTSVVGGPFLVENCLLAYGGRVGDIFGGADVTFRHNTFVNNAGWANGSLLTVNYIPTERFIFENNIAWNNEFGINYQSGGSLPGAKIAGNILVTETISPYRPNCTNVYPAGNFCPQSLTLENYQLPAGSPFKGKGTDGKDPGIDMAQLLTALTGGTPAPPSPSPSPSPSTLPPATPSPSPAQDANQLLLAYGIVSKGYPRPSDDIWAQAVAYWQSVINAKGWAQAVNEMKAATAAYISTHLLPSPSPTPPPTPSPSPSPSPGIAITCTLQAGPNGLTWTCPPCGAIQWTTDGGFTIKCP